MAISRLHEYTNFCIFPACLHVEINRKQKHFGFCSFGRRRNWTEMFLHFGYFLQKGVFRQKGCLSAEILSFCRNATVFLQKAFGFRPFCRKVGFCRNLPLSAETDLFLQKLTSFCRKTGLSVNFCFLQKLSAFCILSFSFCRHRFGWSLANMT